MHFSLNLTKLSMKLTEITIPEEEACKICQGLRKVYNPFKGCFQTCYSCHGDGSYSGVVNEAKLPELFLKDKKLVPYEYGNGKERYQLLAYNKLTAYATMLNHFEQDIYVIRIYSPEECKQDNWANYTGEVNRYLDEIFGEGDGYLKYVFSHMEEIEKCIQTIKRIN